MTSRRRISNKLALLSLLALLALPCLASAQALVQSADDYFHGGAQHYVFGEKQKAQEQAGGEMAIDGTEADAEHSCGELSERGKQVWRSGSGINGGGKE